MNFHYGNYIYMRKMSLKNRNVDGSVFVHNLAIIFKSYFINLTYNNNE